MLDAEEVVAKGKLITPEDAERIAQIAHNVITGDASIRTMHAAWPLVQSALQRDLPTDRHALVTVLNDPPTYAVEEVGPDVFIGCATSAARMIREKLNGKDLGWRYYIVQLDPA